MDERRYRAALVAIKDTVKGYGEDTVFAAFATVADQMGWDLTRRDPGPCCCEYGDFFEREGIMVPRHECPQAAPLLDSLIDPDPLGDYVVEQAMKVVGNGEVIDLRGRWS